MSKDLASTELLARIEDSIGPKLRAAEDVCQRELRTRNPYVADLLTHVTRFRGKRLRPTILLLSGEVAGTVTDAHVTLAAIVELIHTATLIHDDVLDDAATRRFIATVNSRWDTETSILFGDYLFTHAFHLASQLNDIQASRLLSCATNVICAGELEQINERGNLNLDEDTYFRIVEGKTAELCAVSCRLGAVYAGADDQTADCLDNYGRSLGIAFQIADDLLDLLGDEETTGKSLGRDLAKQKLTLPLIRLLGHAEGADAAEVQQMLANPTETTWKELQPLLARSDAVEYSQQRANEYVAEARSHLQTLPSSWARQILEDVAEFAIQRTH